METDEFSNKIKLLIHISEEEENFKYEFYNGGFFWRVAMLNSKSIFAKNYLGFFIKCLGPGNFKDKIWIYSANIILRIYDINGRNIRDFHFKNNFKQGIDDTWCKLKLIKNEELICASKIDSQNDSIKIRFDLIIKPQNNWSHNANNPIGSKISRLFNKKEHSDLKIVCRNQTIWAHSFLLKISSPCFEDILKSSNQTGNGVFEIKEFDPESVKKLLKFIYSGTIVDLNENIGDLYKMANNFKMADLKQICYNYLKMSVDISNFEERLDLSLQYDLAELEDTCKNLFILKRAEFLKKYPEKMIRFDKIFRLQEFPMLLKLGHGQYPF